MSHRKDEATRIITQLLNSYRTGPWENDHLVTLAIDAMESSGVFNNPPPKGEVPSAAALDTTAFTRFRISAWEEDGDLGCQLLCSTCGDDDVDSIDEALLSNVILTAISHNNEQHS